MITIFNRKELLVTWEADVINSAEQILKENNIPYILRMEDTPGGNAPGAGRLRGLPLVQWKQLYRIYIKKDAFEYASYLIRNRSVL